MEEKRELGNSRSDSCQFMLVIHRRLTANRNYPFVRLFPLRPNHLPLLLLFAVIHFPTSRSSADYRDLPQICSPGLSDVIGFKQYIIHRRQTDDESSFKSVYVGGRRTIVWELSPSECLLWEPNHKVL